MKRRKFLALAGLATAGVAVPSVAFSSTPFLEQAVMTIITRELHFLKLDKEGVAKFAKDYVPIIDRYSLIKNQRARVKISLEYLLMGSLKRTETPEILSVYLRATDFFHNKMDTSKIVRYMGLRDPYTNPCNNPFSHLFYPPDIV